MPEVTHLTTTAVPDPDGRPITLAMRALGIAISQIGFKDAHIEKYMSIVGQNKQPCDAAFVYWCVQKAADEMGVPHPLRASATPQVLLNDTPVQYRRTLPGTIPRKGDMFIIGSEAGDASTAGFITSIQFENITTIEVLQGEVVRSTRPMRSITALIRL